MNFNEWEGDVCVFSKILPWVVVLGNIALEEISPRISMVVI